jgi:hypothetical protein
MDSSESKAQPGQPGAGSGKIFRNRRTKTQQSRLIPKIKLH